MTLTANLLFSRFCPNYVDMCEANIGFPQFPSWWFQTFSEGCPMDEAPDVPESIPDFD